MKARQKLNTHCRYCGRHERAETRADLRDRLSVHLRSCQGMAARVVDVEREAEAGARIEKGTLIDGLVQLWVPEFTEAEA